MAKRYFANRRRMKKPVNPMAKYGPVWASKVNRPFAASQLPQSHFLAGARRTKISYESTKQTVRSTVGGARYIYGEARGAVRLGKAGVRGGRKIVGAVKGFIQRRSGIRQVGVADYSKNSVQSYSDYQKTAPKINGNGNGGSA